MAKLLIMSDLHTESAPFDLHLPPGADLVLLAGDIGYGAAGVTFAKLYFPPDLPVAVIAGNHEFFRGELAEVIALCRAEAAKTRNVRFLESEEAIFDLAGTKVRVLGCVLWTDYMLFGTREVSFEAARIRLPDFKRIEYRRNRYLRPEDVAQLHETSREWLKARLATPFDGKTLVVTHRPQPPVTAPCLHWRCIDAGFHLGS